MDGSRLFITADHFVDIVRLSDETKGRIFHTQREVVFDGKCVNDVEFLVQGADPLLSGVLGIAWYIVPAVQKRRAACARVRTGQDFDQGRFPSSVFPNQAVDGVTLDIETYIVDRPNTGKVFNEISDLQVHSRSLPFPFSYVYLFGLQPIAQQ